MNIHDTYSRTQSVHDAHVAGTALYLGLLDDPAVTHTEASDKADVLEAYALEDVNECPQYPHH